MRQENAHEHQQKHASWMCYDFQSKLDRWENSRHTILTTLFSDDDQYVLEGTCDTVMYTNIGDNDLIDCELHIRKQGDLMKTEAIVKLAHQNSEEELNHRSIKEFIGAFCQDLLKDILPTVMLHGYAGNNRHCSKNSFSVFFRYF